MAAGRLTEIYNENKDEVAFFIVYIREAHALDSRSPSGFEMIEDPIDFDERTAVATQCVADLNMPMPAIVDKLDDAVSKAYGGWPDRLYLIGADGKIAYAGGQGPFLFAPDELDEAIRAELKKAR